MALRLRLQYISGAQLGCSIERLSDGTYYDFAESGPTAGTFSMSPTTLILGVPEDANPFAGRYKLTLSNTPSTQFTDGQYCVSIHNRSSADRVVGQLGLVMKAGDDSPAFPSPAIDPWATPLPGPYESGTAGALIGSNLDVKVSTRSTYSGGPVASVASPVVVGTNNDKSGYSLSSSGLDAIVIEDGINARQAASAILAATAGTLSGAGTGSIVINGANVSEARITATTDASGNRSQVSLSLPT
ncbi:hypothetical protein BH23PLA1_BH23PLA1_29590 [soil metagenome]